MGSTSNHNYNYTPETGQKSSDSVGFIKVHAGLAAAALKSGQHAALAVWTMGRALDNAGSGKVDDDTMRAAFSEIGWSDYKYRRARFLAAKLGLIHFASNTLYLCSLVNAALALDADRIGRTVPLDVLRRSDLRRFWIGPRERQV